MRGWGLVQVGADQRPFGIKRRGILIWSRGQERDLDYLPARKSLHAPSSDSQHQRRTPGESEGTGSVRAPQPHMGDHTAVSSLGYWTPSESDVLTRQENLRSIKQDSVLGGTNSRRKKARRDSAQSHASTRPAARALSQGESSLVVSGSPRGPRGTPAAPGEPEAAPPSRSPRSGRRATSDPSKECTRKSWCHRGTSFIRKRLLQGPYSRPVHRALTRS